MAGPTASGPTAPQAGGDTISAPAAVADPAPPPVPEAAASIASPAAPGALHLRGTLGGAAILELPGGRQILARIGRSVAPGVVLAGVGRDHVLLEAGGQRLRLGFGDAAAAVVAAPAPVATPAAAVRPAAGPVVPGLAEAAREAGRAYVLGLRPVEANGRTTGFRVEPGTRMPGLAEAGLQPGDIIRMVNGVDFTDEERVMELGDEIAGSYELIVEFERGGQRLTRTVAVNPRPAEAQR
jgi:general secretion pathway protein C